MGASYSNIQSRLKAFDFKGLFTQELMWNNFPTRELEVPVDGVTYTLRPVAQRGMAVFECLPPTDKEFPKYAVRRKIDTQVSKSAREHIIIFHDHGKTVQTWQWVKREAGKPSACREQIFYTGQSGDALIQKIQTIAFSLEDEENVTETVQRVGAAFDVEKVTKKFYELFQKEHDTFLKFVAGIPDKELERWYVSVMLNRLMFIYFIQKKEFLGGDQHYLSNKLAESKKQGKDKFYRGFLCPLFFEGFAKRSEQRNAAANRLLGQVPYLNGGLFLKHYIEELHGKTINVPDKAFERIFDFFEQYDWHLDDRPTRTGREINPDVLGYVFEKYINQKQMGAYYTREDITEYISKNRIIPALFDMASKSCRIAFEGEHSVWRLLESDSDRLIYAPMLRGMDKKLPDFIAAGIANVAKRDRWDEPASVDYALPTETWREVVARRQRVEEVRQKLSSGEIKSIADLITYNLDIGRFAEEVIATCEGTELLRAFYKAIRTISVLDPACGSGAFLFAALNILERLYDTCLVRMQAFVDDMDRSGEKHSPEKFKDFRQTLEEMNDKQRHPSPRYFVLKSIILNNLYGVDIMEEATEICKLRLFLKLVSQVGAHEKIEPLPDIDFNIRAGNTLVGYANEAELDKALSRLGHGDEKQEIEEDAEAARLAFERFRQQQVVGETGSPEDMAIWKADVQERLTRLRFKLDDYLSGDYNVRKGDEAQFARWRNSHHPFHWFVEFFGIMRSGQFDVIIGNPPFVEYGKVRSQYTVKNFLTEDCANLYAFMMERSIHLLHRSGYLGLIVPIAAISVGETESLRSLLKKHLSSLWLSNYAIRPAKLFDGVEQRLTIAIGQAAAHDVRGIYSTKYNQWYVDERPHLFARLTYCDVTALSKGSCIPKIGDHVLLSIIKKIQARQGAVIGQSLVKDSKNLLFFHRTPGYWIRIMDFEPFFKSPTHNRSIHHIRELKVSNTTDAKVIGAVVSSSMYFAWFFAVGNCRNLTLEDVKLFPLGLVSPEIASAASKLFDKLMKDYDQNSVIHARGETKFQEFDWGASKHIVDEIDRVIGSLYELSDEEIDYAISYDLKIRLGRGDSIEPDEDTDVAKAGSS